MNTATAQNILQVSPGPYCLNITEAMIAAIQHELDKTTIPTGTPAYIHFRDPDYSAEKGGFRPVEVYVGEDGSIRYITEFSWVGTAPMCDLAKSADFDFSQGVYQDFYSTYELNTPDVKSFWKIWQSNFLEYRRMGIYRVEVNEGP